ncbi:hypothetical protein LCGC14_1128490 [marine sediment metagenome]|uniref:Uncharacterized protein n=1 Tax=marine sediment metagenome TaxID=412755 RepID=A0A0F9MPL3_9ZZZZ
MSNMSYCRFENTLADLHDCYNNINDTLSDSESRARDGLIILCREFGDIWIKSDYEPDYEPDDTD